MTERQKMGKQIVLIVFVLIIILAWCVVLTLFPNPPNM
jgi:hypothetical protein